MGIDVLTQELSCDSDTDDGDKRMSEERKRQYVTDTGFAHLQLTEDNRYNGGKTENNDSG